SLYSPTFLFFNATAPTELYTLSLHDALPISGKTLLSLAGALEQRRNYHQIYLARPIVPLSNRDIGYLPGDVNSKLNPYMEPLWRSEEHTSELQSRENLVCRLLLEKKKTNKTQ